MSRKPEEDPIEAYLNAVSRYLRAMPTEEAAAALEEMRSHLHVAISELVENGIEEERAVADVLKRFGSAKTVGQAIAKASLNAWLAEVDKREGLFVARSLRAMMYFAQYGTYAIVFLLLFWQRHTPVWTLVTAFFLGLLGGNLEGVLTRLARRRLPSRERLNALSEEYAKLTRSFGLEPPLWNPISSASMEWFSSSDAKPFKIIVEIVFILYCGAFAAWALYTDCRPFGIIALYWMGQRIAYLTSLLQTRANSNAERVKN